MVKAEKFRFKGRLSDTEFRWLGFSIYKLGLNLRSVK